MNKLGLSQLAALVLSLSCIWVEFLLLPCPVPMDGGPLLAWDWSPAPGTWQGSTQSDRVYSWRCVGAMLHLQLMARFVIAQPTCLQECQVRGNHSFLHVTTSSYYSFVSFISGNLRNPSFLSFWFCISGTFSCRLCFPKSPSSSLLDMPFNG